MRTEKQARQAQHAQWAQQRDQKRLQKMEGPPRRPSMLVWLVLFVFIILLVALAGSFGLVYLLATLGLLSPEGSIWPLIIYLLLASLIISLFLTVFMGRRSLRPFRRLTEATGQVAAGNFDVRVAVRGPTEMRQLAASFNEMAEELGGIETLRSDFVNNISHEFKTPVVSIRGFAKLLKKDTLAKEKRDEYLNIIIAESERLTRLSSNVLLLSNLESTAKAPESTSYSLDEQLRQAVLLLAPQMDRQGLALEVELAPVRITANEELMQQVWLNLLSNAIKFTPGGGAVRVKLAQTKGAAVVTVTDTGPGMDEETQKRMFDKFYQGDASRATEGNGLGMALVKRILDLSGGAVAVQSAPGQGSSFIVTLGPQ